jgi:hypothetical protein
MNKLSLTRLPPQPIVAYESLHQICHHKPINLAHVTRAQRACEPPRKDPWRPKNDPRIRGVELRRILMDCCQRQNGMLGPISTLESRGSNSHHSPLHEALAQPSVLNPFGKSFRGVHCEAEFEDAFGMKR